MAQQKTGADLFAELDALGSESATSSTPSKPVVQASATTTSSGGQEEDDASFALDDIQKQLAAKSSQQTSRPITPRLSSSTTSGTTNNRSPKRVEHTPASSGAPSERNSEERGRSNLGVGLGVGRSSGEGRSFHQGSVPEEAVVQEQQQQEKVVSGGGGGGGGWGWGSFFSTAAAAVSQAQSLAKEIRASEDAQKYTEMVRGYGAGLQSLSSDLRSKAMPTFTSLITHIAPPISAHERLSIHATHDIINYPSLDPLIYTTFSRVMSQVEGGDLMVIQRGSENRSRSASSEEGYRGSLLNSATGGGGWTDGPWWRDDMSRRDLGIVAGLKEGTRLVRVSAESYAKEYFDARGGVEEAARVAAEGLSESNPVRRSDIFLAIQAVSYPSSSELFAGDAREAEKEKENTVVDPEAGSEEDQVAFAIYLHDPIHSLSFSTLSQAFPQKWAAWLDAPAQPSSQSPTTENRALPESILEIIAAGGVDPREWIAEWMEETLSLAVGVVAQNYVARRMGVGDGGLGKGKRRVEDEGVGGEAARAL